MINGLLVYNLHVILMNFIETSHLQGLSVTLRPSMGNTLTLPTVLLHLMLANNAELSVTWRSH